jgi:serine/threonine-protein kinase
VSEEISRMISSASVLRDRVELPQEGIFPESLEEHELPVLPGGHPS